MTANACNDLSALPAMPVITRWSANPEASRWAIVLSGGEGERMRPLIRDWLGEERPKQYCTFVGGRSMFKHTIDRACCIVPDEQVVTIVGQGHRKFLNGSSKERLPGVLLEQPGNLGTAPGIFLSVAYVLAVNPEATVIILPSDHFVHPENRFCDYVIRAFELAESHGDKVVLAAAIPDRAETDYGWIDPSEMEMHASRALLHGSKKVLSFREKPGVKEAHRLFRHGSLWNTMVIAVKAKTLWALGQQCLPEMMYEFNAFLLVLRAVREERLDGQYEARSLAHLYEELAPADFSRDILESVSNLSIVLPMDGVDWCDWGRPQRVTESLARLGREPLFPSAHLCPTMARTTP